MQFSLRLVQIKTLLFSRRLNMTINELLGEAYKVTQSNQQGVELTSPDGIKMMLPADKVAAIQANPNDPNKSTLNPEMFASTDSNQPLGPQIGSEVEIPDEITATEERDEEDFISSKHNRDIGGDATDDFIDDVVDKDFERHSRPYDDLDRINHLARFKR